MSEDARARADQISTAENEKVIAAIASLKLYEACARLFFTTDLHRCTNMKFILDSAHPDAIRWEKSDFDDWFWADAS